MSEKRPTNECQQMAPPFKYSCPIDGANEQSTPYPETLVRLPRARCPRTRVFYNSYIIYSQILREFKISESGRSESRNSSGGGGGGGGCQGKQVRGNFPSDKQKNLKTDGGGLKPLPLPTLGLIGSATEGAWAGRSRACTCGVRPYFHLNHLLVAREGGGGAGLHDVGLRPHVPRIRA